MAKLDGRPEEGRQPDRPVRRGLLLGLHRGRPHHRGIAPRGPEGRRGRALESAKAPATSRWRPSPAPRAAPTSSCTCATTRTSSSTPGSSSRHHRQVLRPHQPAHPDGKGGVGRRREEGEPGGGQDRRVGNRQQGQRAVDAPQERHHRRRSTRTSTSRSATTTRTPLAYTHNRVEGRSEYTQLLYIPAKAPFDLWNRDKRGGVKLYVKRVFIMDDAEALMPATCASSRA
jgi:hypothetical protein